MDGGLGGALIGRGLVHQWASSEAALREAIRRRVARAAALCASLGLDARILLAIRERPSVAQ